jgi:hypothetical protein
MLQGTSRIRTPAVMPMKRVMLIAVLSALSLSALPWSIADVPPLPKTMVAAAIDDIDSDGLRRGELSGGSDALSWNSFSK